jgi:hypothetical protein
MGVLIGAKVLPLSRNDERIAAGIIARELPRLLYSQHRDFTQVIIHRDGRYMREPTSNCANNEFCLSQTPKLAIDRCRPLLRSN